METRTAQQLRLPPKIKAALIRYARRYGVSQNAAVTLFVARGLRDDVGAGIVAGTQTDNA